jgi:hypothetical protein
MIPTRRERFNRQFTQEKYDALHKGLEARAGVDIHFRLSETPCFLPASLLRKLEDASLSMVNGLLANPAYRAAADGIVPERFRVNGHEKSPTFICVDFGLLKTDAGVEARLVELQAFPSLFGFQTALAEAHIATYGIEGVHEFLDGLDRASYLRVCGRAMCGDHDPAEVVLMEIDPLHQKTLPDFTITEQLWGVRAVDARTVTREGRRLFYVRDGKRTQIKRVYNRVIPDELTKTGATFAFDYRDDLEVEWTGGPDWFFRISKFSIPWIEHPWVPETSYLDDVPSMPADREEWLLKPLFSFAGGGIIFAPTDADIAAIPEGDRRNYILQRRVHFTPFFETPYGPTQAEVRMMFVRDAESEKYRAVIPLLRMGRGKMMGVDHNRDMEWVGASAALMPVDV